MFLHDEVIIGSNNKVGFGHRVRHWRNWLQDKMMKEIQDSEDKEIFRILDMLDKTGY